MSVSGRIATKVCSIVTLGLMVYAALGPAKWQLRPMLGWKTEHFLGFLIVTLIACLASPRPLVVGLALMAMAGLLEALQGLTPDRIPDLPTALSGARGALLASVAAEAFVRARSSSIDH
jgi:VanZ family protein